MGGGYSNNFTGTSGAMGNQQNYQTTFFDELPVRTKTNGIGVGVTGGDIVSTTKMKQCFCCREYSIPFEIENEACPICGWIDDPYQNANPDSTTGKNPICLNDAREAYNQQ